MPAGIVDDYYYSPLFIDDYLNSGDTSGGNCSLNNHTISQQYFDSNNSDVSSGYGLKKTATLSPNVNIIVRLIIFMMMLKRVIIM